MKLSTPKISKSQIERDFYVEKIRNVDHLIDSY